MKTPILYVLAICVALSSCEPARQATVPSGNRVIKPAPAPGTMDTIRWRENNTRPVIKDDAAGAQKNMGSGQTWHIGYLLPFLTEQTEEGSVPEKSRFALQFYAGAKLAMEDLSAEGKIRLKADVWDTHSSDEDFTTLLEGTPGIQKPVLYIGPARTSQVEIFAEWAKKNRKIVISPESPASGLTENNPGFIQINPSLQSHCEAIMAYILENNSADAVTLVCREKEKDRLDYFRSAGTGAGTLQELVIPDGVNNFDKADLKKYLKPGKVNTFILPSWGSQDFVMAFLRKLREVKGANKVEVYGMPQWQNFESIDGEYFSILNVHISSAFWADHSDEKVKRLENRFYEMTGTLPDEDAFTGYDVTLFAGKMLLRYGLSFPDRLQRESYAGLQGKFRFGKNTSGTVDTGDGDFGYWENREVMILRFGNDGFRPVGTDR